MQIAITGISGYIGQNISKKLMSSGHAIFGIKRQLLYGEISELAALLANKDIVINLAGAPILQRWTAKNKQLIYNSRIVTSNNLVKAIEHLPPDKRPGKFITASAIGIYKNGSEHDENSVNFNPGFDGKLVKDWEAASKKLPTEIKRIVFRIGIVIGKKSKMIQNLQFPFKIGLGATIGKGLQTFPFIHITDLTNIFTEAVETDRYSQTYNLVAPETTNNKHFTKTYAKALHRPAIFKIPPFILHLVYGKAAQLLTTSPTVISQKLIDQEYQFLFPNIESALKEIVS